MLYKNFETLKEDLWLYKSLKTHQKNVQPLAQSYHGMGHYNVIVLDEQNRYHCLIVGGANDWDRISCEIKYKLYKFDKHCGLYSNLNENTEINCRFIDDEVHPNYQLIVKNVFAQINDLPEDIDINEFIDEEIAKLNYD